MARDNLGHTVSVLATPITKDGVYRILFQVEGIDSSYEVKESLLRLGRSMAVDLGWTLGETPVSLDSPTFTAVGIVDSHNFAWEIGLFFAWERKRT